MNNNKNKELIMNKITKIGVSALCGSLAGIASANAGSLSVSGGADMSWTSLEKSTNGNPIGMGSNVGFTGTGELDNGTAFTLSIAHTNKAGYSSANVTMDMPTLGSLIITQGVSGTGIDRIDDMMPTAWEETWGTGLGTGIRTVAGVSGGAGFEWTPNADMLPEGVSMHLAYSPRVGGGSSNDKATAGDDAGVGSGWDLVVKHSGLVDGLSLFAGASDIEQPDEDAASTTTGNRTQYAYGATYAINRVTLGYQVTRDNQQSSADSATSYYENDMWGVSFNINDDLSISYGNHESTRQLTNSTSVTAEAESLQIAYSMGGASIRLAESSVDNGSYTSTTTNDRDGTTLSLSLAF